MNTDYVQRFLFARLDIRGRLVCLGNAWRDMQAHREYPARIVTLLGNTTGLAVLLGANRKGSGRITLQVRGSGTVRLLVVDCTADLRIRGMAQLEGDVSDAASERDLLGDGRLALTLEDTRAGKLYQSMVPLEGDTLQDIFESYISRSEQLPALLRLRADGQALYGLLLEKLPGADERDADGWNRVTQFASTLALAETCDTQPYDLLTRLFPEELLRVYPVDRVQYHCPYDPEKVKDMLRSLGRSEVESILAEKGEVVVRNEMCNHVYRFDADAIGRLFTGA